MRQSEIVKRIKEICKDLSKRMDENCKDFDKRYLAVGLAYARLELEKLLAEIKTGGRKPPATLNRRFGV